MDERMEDRLQAYIDDVFRPIVPTKEARDLKKEILLNLLDRYHDLIEKGYRPEAAYNITVTSIGDMNELLSGFKKIPGKNDAGGSRFLSFLRIANLPFFVILYFLVSFSTDAWYITWVLFPIAIAVGNLIRAVSNGKGVRRIVLWSLAAVLLTGFLAWGLAESQIPSPNYYPNGDSYIAGGGEIAADEITYIEINWTAGEVQVSPWEGDTIQIEESSSEPLREANTLHYCVLGDMLLIQPAASGPSWSLFPAPEEEPPEKTLELRLPAGLASHLDTLSVYTDTASMELFDLRADDLYLDSTSGNQSLWNVRARELFTGTMSGRIKANGLTVTKELSMDTFSGDAQLAGSVEALDFESTSGNLELSTEICPSDLSTDTISGDVTLYLPENSGFTCDMDNLSGEISSDFSLESGDDLMRCGDGRGSFSFETVSGSVQLLKK